jgi:ABC-type oligopeptide transport system substrate-binding subunit
MASSIARAGARRPAAAPASRAGGRRYFGTIADSRSRVQLGLTGWVADFLTPSTFFESSITCARLMPASNANGNLSQFCDRPVDAAFARAAAATGPQADGLWTAMDRRVMRDAAAVPWTNPPRRAARLRAGRQRPAAHLDE